MRENVLRIIYQEKKRSDKLVRKQGGTYEDHRPSYFSEEIWHRFCEWWRSEQFSRRSTAARAARGRVKTPHTSGALSFERRKRDFVKKNNKEPEPIELFKDTHTLRTRNPGVVISGEAQAIMDRYMRICAEKGIDHRKTQMQAWVEAVEGPNKNRIVGFPRIRASEVLGTQTRPSRRIGEGGSGPSTFEHIRDDLRAVDQTVARAREHPEEFALSAAEVRLLARDLLDGEAQLPPNHPHMEQTQRELIRVIIEVLNDMYKRGGPGNKGQRD